MKLDYAFHGEVLDTLTVHAAETWPPEPDVPDHLWFSEPQWLRSVETKGKTDLVPF
jgi:hypothetical protein